MKWIDITQPMQNHMVVWPGDTEFDFHLTWKKRENGVVNVGQLRCSTHTGTHMDAPFHFNDDGLQIHQMDVSIGIGRAQVIHLPHLKEITVSDLKAMNIQNVQRLLICTHSVPDPSVFPKKYTTIHPDVAPYMKEKGILLLGLDTPSVDHKESKKLLSHHALHKHGIFILENLMLTDVKEGIYELIALPLRIVGADGSPVRAILRRLE